MQLLNRLDITEDGKNELIQALKMRLSGNTFLVGMYIGPQTSGEIFKESMTNIKGGKEERTIITGDLTADI